MVQCKNEVISLTFGDMGENHVGMEKIGKMVKVGEGFNRVDLERFADSFQKFGLKCEMHCLNDLFDGNTADAHVLVVRKGVRMFLKGENDENDLRSEMDGFEWDDKYFDTRRQKVLNKRARTNVCFGFRSSEPDYERKKGRVVGFDQVKCLNMVKVGLKETLGGKCAELVCEGNRYFDLKKCGIGFHGDGERRKVVACRLGSDMDLHFNWFIRSRTVGEKLELTLGNGDMCTL